MKAILKRIDKYAFWILCVAIAGLTFAMHYNNHHGAMVLLLLLFVLTLGLGVRYANSESIQEAIDEYEQAVNHQVRRQRLVVLKGGKPNERLDQ